MKFHKDKSCCLPGPSSEALFLLIGESHKSDVLMYIQCAMKYFSNSGKLQSHGLPLAPSYHVAASRSLCFPGKVACISAPANSNDATSVNNNSNKLMERLAVSDTGNHRVMIFTPSGKVEVISVNCFYSFNYALRAINLKLVQLLHISISEMI